MKNHLIASAVVAVLVSLCSLSLAQEAREESIKLYKNFNGKIFYNSTFFINDQDSPVEIVSVQARHVPTETAELAKALWDQLYKYLSDEEKDKLRANSSPDLTVEINAKGKNAVAVKFGVIAYDAFKEYLGGLTAVTMEPPTLGMTWEFQPTYLFKFKKYGVVGVYVRQVRLRDGSIWNFDAAKIVAKVSERFTDITKEKILNTD